MQSQKPRAQRLSDALCLLRAQGKISFDEIEKISGKEESQKIIDVLKYIGAAKTCDDGLLPVQKPPPPTLDATYAVEEYVMGGHEAAALRGFYKLLHETAQSGDESGKSGEEKDSRDSKRVKRYITSYIDVSEIAEQQGDMRETG